MTLSANVINSIPGIQRKSYLELGVSFYNGTFADIKARIKVSVDTDPFQQPRHLMTTDQFFEHYAGCYPPFDVIYIDADHRVASVLRDFNNAQKFRQSKGGLILVHDLIPNDEKEIQSCGDGFRFLYLMRLRQSCFFSEDATNHGLTIFYNPVPVGFTMEELKSITWAQFVEQQQNYRVFTNEEMCRKVAALAV